MSTWLVITGGTAAAQYDTRLPRPPLREGVLQEWLDGQPELARSTGLWNGEHLTAEVHVVREVDGLRSVGWDVSRRGTDASEAEFRALRRRLVLLARQLGGRVWDDDDEAFVE